ncbi:MAG: hypothetical protein DLM72_19130 [Candidatus Nitrosopolaris wilkensis]|nr:MAG: hypothetical protein DLM72_19130 [Candidatus Nitrosopolaris wilkensis]
MTDLLIQFIEIKRIVFLTFFIVLIVFWVQAISSSIAAEGQQQVSSKFNVRITYPPPRQQVPIGNSLTIFGTSTYNTTKDCTVYANSNNLKFQTVTAVGPSGKNNYSSWIFSYAKNYHPITAGINKLTAKISCKGNPNNLTAYYITNVTGIIERNNINSFNNLNQQGNNILESTIHNNLNLSNNNANTLTGSNNNVKISNSPFWFPNLFHNDVTNSNDNTNNNSNSRTTQSLQESSKVLGISVRVAKNPIAWGNEQTIKMSVFDPNTNQPISNAIVTGSIVTLPTLKTGLTKEFMLVTGNSGTASYSWLIADNNTKSGLYNLIIHVSAAGYHPNSVLTKFRLMPVVLSSQNNIQNKTSNNIHNNIHNKNGPAISTLHT